MSGGGEGGKVVLFVVVKWPTMWWCERECVFARGGCCWGGNGSVDSTVGELVKVIVLVCPPEGKCGAAEFWRIATPLHYSAGNSGTRSSAAFFGELGESVPRQIILLMFSALFLRVKFNMINQ